MTKDQLLAQVATLSDQDRTELVLELWDAVGPIADFPPLTGEQRCELDRRLDVAFAGRNYIDSRTHCFSS